MLRRTLLVSLLLLVLLVPSALAQRSGARTSTGGPKTVSVKGYTRKDGTYVQPHMRSAPGTGVRIEPRLGYRVSAPGYSGVPAGTPAVGDVEMPAPKHQPAPAVVEEDLEAKADREEKAAASVLNLQRDLIERGKKEEAKQRLQQLIERYPKTRAAEEARVLLKKR
jgi:hypothetical protein